MSALKNKGLATTGIPLSFLLGCSESALGSFELARLSEVADLRTELHKVLDRLIDQMSMAAVAAWFRTVDVPTLKQAIEEPEDILAWAQERIRDKQRGDDEIVPMASLPVGSAHLAAALRYQERNIAKGLCSICPKPLSDRSVRYCDTHLTAARLRHNPKGGKDEAPGSINYLYQDRTPENRHGRQPGTLTSLQMAREQRTRKVLAREGIPPESAAVSLMAAKEALLAHMPDSESKAIATDALFKRAMIPSRTTGQRAIRELFLADRIQRTGSGSMKDAFRYFRSEASK
jgi:hypothetical protein